MRAIVAPTHELGAPGHHPPPLPLGSGEFPDDTLAIVCSFLSPVDLGRLACVARRFTQPALTEPGASGRCLTELSVIEEGARLRLVAAGRAADLADVAHAPGESWLRALWQAEHGLVFVPCDGITTSCNGMRCIYPCCCDSRFTCSLGT